MTALLAIPLFLLGLHLCLRTIAALFRVLDLWFTIGTAWPRVVRGIVGWGGSTVVMAALLPDRFRSPFLWGFGTFLAFFLGAYVLRFFLVLAITRWRLLRTTGGR